jgi:hypothetical protein
VTPRVIVAVDIEEDTNCKSRIIDDDEDPFSDDESKYHDDTVEYNESTQNYDEPTAPPKINLEEKVEQQQKMIDFPFQHNPKLIE